MTLIPSLLAQTTLTGITGDSRKVLPGYLFLAYPGDKADGRQHIAEAIVKGASAILWEQQDYQWDARWDITNAPVVGLRQQLGVIADDYYGHPSAQLWMMGVTGTNGKTSCSHWLAQAFNQLGRKASVVGTLGNGFLADGLSAALNTTPDAVQLHGMLAAYLAQGAQAVAMEVSSHGLDQGRVNCVKFDIAVFTNLSRDHLDYHADMAAYAAAKRKLFDADGLSCAIVNVDDDYGRQLDLELRQQGRQVLTYGLLGGDVHGSQLSFDELGLSMQVHTPQGDALLRAPVLGRFNASNLLAVLAALLMSDVALTDAIAALAGIQAVPGRMQQFGGGHQPLVVVDYAHTPDALEKVLLTLRETSSGKLLCVFGCGGSRDAGKRPLMGAVATRLADQVVITSDNPRDEDPQAIITAVVAGASGEFQVEPDRAAAIRLAIDAAASGDVVLVAGKGHETYQEIAGVHHPFDDTQVVQQILREAA